MLARTAASLDILSGRRFEFGLGAGAFPLDEALDILRGARQSGEHGSLRFQDKRRSGAMPSVVTRWPRRDYVRLLPACATPG